MPSSQLHFTLCLNFYFNVTIYVKVKLVVSTSWSYTFCRSQFSSVTQSCLTLCDPMDSSTPGFAVHHHILEIAQTHVHRVRDAIQPSHPMSSPSPAFSLSQHQCLSPWVNSSDQVAKVLEFQLQHQSFEWIHCNSLDSFQWIIRTDFF